ncbi:MBL fold metallo-hydrolase RNA specificity domain-containing protein [Fusibacillus kribbianus]|uniref:MBL fold metallo-hydrolase n=1 Tax=Fusibacillus kribbianus TaxID=3044208 RepID=A0AAP4BDY5_9FIRM|nr:MBL fold metallo-hydrolase [Ruminococcus sp. YH-rum2234]MDI9243246.1 MBL fold metallo-hydrolase [Ruminococcus sp. YH-rum2234]
MELIFLGADHEVTGSCHMVKAAGKNLLIDCGMEQGEDIYENQEIPVAASEIDAVLLTHAHIDHSGLLPLLYAKGFRGAVYATEATCDLCRIMLRDSAHIQEFEAEWRNRKAKRSGAPEYVPLYTMEDAVGLLEQLVPCGYDATVTIFDGIQVRFSDVGHLLGSASIELWLTEEEETKKLVFSGDVGNLDQPLIRDPQYLDKADYVVMESTYGDRVHSAERVDYVKELTEVLKRTFDRGGNVVIPSFAVGRTQEMLYFLRKIKTERLVEGHEGFRVYVDSPLAVEATSIFNKHQYDCFDEEATALLRQGIDPIQFPGLTVSVTSDDSKQINFDPEPKVILSASGMCEAGRIRHHLKHNLWRPESTILFVGYQSAGTLGRAILEGAETVRLFGETIEVKAEIKKLDGISGHADKTGLLKWVNSFEPKPKRVFVVHGEDSVCDSFAECLKEEYGMDAYAPFSGAVYDMMADSFVSEGVRILKRREKPAAKRASTVFARLVAAGERLMAVIRKNEGGANKDLAKLADQINMLCDKWER